MAAADTFYAIDGATGKERSAFPISAASTSAAIGADGTIYVGAYDGKVYAIGP